MVWVYLFSLVVIFTLVMRVISQQHTIIKQQAEDIRQLRRLLDVRSKPSSGLSARFGGRFGTASTGKSDGGGGPRFGGSGSAFGKPPDGKDDDETTSGSAGSRFGGSSLLGSPRFSSGSPFGSTRFGGGGSGSRFGSSRFGKLSDDDDEEEKRSGFGGSRFGGSRFGNASDDGDDEEQTTSGFGGSRFGGRSPFGSAHHDPPMYDDEEESVDDDDMMPPDPTLLDNIDNPFHVGPSRFSPGSIEYRIDMAIYDALTKRSRTDDDSEDAADSDDIVQDDDDVKPMT